jgi:poly-gamma-glutamate capsule biosynthesis protein CapA/YwtB (metallophosphatase superfamily)
MARSAAQLRRCDAARALLGFVVLATTFVARIATRRHPNIAAVAMANKTARIAIAMMKNGTDYQPELAAG